MQWAPSTSSYHTPLKTDDNMMLRLDELIEQDAYDEYVTLASLQSNLSEFPSSPEALPHLEASSISSSSPLLQNFRGNTVNTSLNGPMALTKPIPPPASLPRKHDPSTANQRVVYPAKESCYNLPIMFPSIPEGGTKSRVETQIRVTVDLADPSTSTDPFKYDRVGAWKWLRLPSGSATKKRTRKQGKIDPDVEDVLQLAVSVTCASPPHNRVLSCTSCQAREAKRVAKKLAARVRPARSDSESGEGDGTKPRKHHEDTTNIIQFNCAEILDFSTGSVVLPLRITCYCRHHREKVGFNVHFTMMDSTGRLIGSGMTKPIMITDDHKTTGANRSAELVASFTCVPGAEWAAHPQPIPPLDSRAPSRRKKEPSTITTAKRPKPYDSASKPKKGSREGSVTSLPSPSPSASYSSLPTRSPTPSVIQSAQHYTSHEIPSYSQPPPLQASTQSSESSPDTLATPLDPHSDIFLLNLQPSLHHPTPQSDLLAMNQQLAQSSLPPPIPLPVPSMTIPPQAHSMPFMLFDSAPQSSQSLQLQLPTIHRLIPNNGPMHGGIEVTVLGANFHHSIRLDCIFGDVAASSTQRWSENTLVCVLPPRATPGVVSVWFEGFPKMEDPMSSPASLFTYLDESDRALMELALQVVGLKMTGKIEDAKNVAMRIVGTAGSDSAGSQGGNSNEMMQMQLSSSSALESRVIKLLSVIDTPLNEDGSSSTLAASQAISYASPVGQTLLHLASFLGFPALVQFLIDHDIDIDARDRNGYTALHFAALVKSTDCAKLLVDAGADREIVNSLGKTAQEIAPAGFFDEFISIHILEDSDRSESSEDEEAEWGDGEEDAGEERRLKALKRRASQRGLRRKSFTASKKGTPKPSRASSPPPPPVLPSVEDLLDSKDSEKARDAKEDDEKRALDAKQTASFVEMIQRTLAQLHAPQLPDLPGMVPWNALPQIPMVFPVFVPMMPNWPSFLGGENATSDKQEEPQQGLSMTALRAAQEWRATWEKWVALGVANTVRQGEEQAEELPPPVYSAKPADGEQIPAASTSAVEGSKQAVRSRRASAVAEIRPVGYNNKATLPVQVIESFAYQPAAKQKSKNQKKDDQMLMWFWVPILLLSAIWALLNGWRLVMRFISPAAVSITSA
ncbi:hypothetical protein FA13DRAFT_1786140 [Coprinellus micaceus]|uniref:IPT/TIG domain-containing protein n=1 Tax=Coprinellus micaceus TaxID=71717 RepID=A0A4Y7TXQ4_COPMI|nr:hypothetical protein FA13DRAFT_1786140 [Coprinellus micaceus]